MLENHLWFSLKLSSHGKMLLLHNFEIKNFKRLDLKKKKKKSSSEISK